MSEEAKPVGVMILDKEYLIACPDDEVEALQATARFLDRRMREIRDRGSVVGIDRIAVMAALNIAHDYLQNKQHSDSLNQSLGTRIRSLQEKIELALNRGKQMEF